MINGKRQMENNYCSVTAWPDCKFPGFTTTNCPTLIPDLISIQSSPRRPVITTFSTALPPSTVITFSMPANVTNAEVGMVTFAGIEKVITVEGGKAVEKVV